jgi:hypothetical protein
VEPEEKTMDFAGIPSLERLLDATFEGARLRRSGHHGEAHWRRVALGGLDICAKTPGADPFVAVLFGLIHDARRLDEDIDLEHGDRATFLIDHLSAEGILDLTALQLASLREACSGHSHGGVSALNRTVATCWDADRCELRRGNTERDHSLLVLAAPFIGEVDAFIDGHPRLPGWGELFDLAARIKNG